MERWCRLRSQPRRWLPLEQKEHNDTRQERRTGFLTKKRAPSRSWARHAHAGSAPILLCLLFFAIGPPALSAQVLLVKACVVLNARLSSSSIEASAAASRGLPLAGPQDTGRIQRALQLCDPGDAVVLQADGERDAFLSDPLVIPRGVVLFVPKGVTLYASRNRRAYDLWPHSCGVAGGVRHGCKPFLFAYQAAFSGVEGAGTIDGQGGAASLGETTSWWDSQAAAEQANKPFSAPALVSSYESQGFMLNGVHLRNAAGIHVAMYKTIQFETKNIDIAAPPAAHGAGGVLLSNSPRATLANITIQVPGVAVDVRGSILGATANVDLTNLKISGGEGISMGDPVYGGVSAISLNHAVIENANRGFGFDLRGKSLAFEPQNKAFSNLPAPPRDVHLQNVCLEGVAQPLQIMLPAKPPAAPAATAPVTPSDTESGGNSVSALPAGQSISFTNVVVAGLGPLTAHGAGPGASAADTVSNAESNAAATCDSAAAASGAQQTVWTVDLSTLQKPGPKAHLVVAQDGSGDARTVQAAVDALPDTGGEIDVKPGVYREVVTIRKPHVRLHGLGSTPANTEIVFNHGAQTSGGTFNTATVFVEADNVTVDNLTINNDLGNHGQAVALAALGDRDVFRNVRILGAQDTLFAASKYCYGDDGPCVPARQYFEDCYVAGNTDFIFGDSAAVFERCELHGIAGPHVMYTAQSKHNDVQYSGYVLDHCRLTAEPAAHDITLGRPWRPHATVVYLDTQMDAPVIPAGWTEWPRFGVPSLPIAYYAEYRSTGPGADSAAREPSSHQLTAKQAAQWLPARFLAGKDGWRPERPLPPRSATGTVSGHPQP